MERTAICDPSLAANAMPVNRDHVARGSHYGRAAPRLFCASSNKDRAEMHVQNPARNVPDLSQIEAFVFARGLEVKLGIPVNQPLLDRACRRMPRHWALVEGPAEGTASAFAAKLRLFALDLRA